MARPPLREAQGAPVANPAIRQIGLAHGPWGLNTAAMKFAPPLPIDAVLDALRTAMAAHASAILVAPPGAGKTTRVPLALMDEGWLQGRKILVLEPRRIAARAAAERMAQ